MSENYSLIPASIGIAGLICVSVWGKPGLGAENAEKMSAFANFAVVFIFVLVAANLMKRFWNRYF